MSISEKMRKQIRGLSQASENAEEGISLVQVADGAMNEIHAMLQRGNELCIQAANGTLSDSDRVAIQAEMEELEKEIIDHVASTIDFSAYDGSTEKKEELLGQGFYTTCCTCSNHYSIRFTEGTGTSREQSGQHYIFNIGIDNINTANDLVQAIIEVTTTGSDSGNPLNHYTIFENEKGT